MWDNHMHSSFSGDCQASPIEMINSAKKKGLDGMTFTDHLDIDYNDEPGLFDLDIENYYSQQKELANQFSTDKFKILTGIEIGLQPHIANENKKVIDSQKFDFVIGSTHVIDGKDPYYDYFWESDSIENLLTSYYEAIYKNITSFPHFDSLGHLDYCFRYVRGNAIDSYDLFQDIVTAILEKIIKLDKALEINTGALIKGFKEPNPSIKIIRRYKELGGKLITTGADAHHPQNIAIGFDKLPELLKECGFLEYAVYVNRKPTLYRF